MADFYATFSALSQYRLHAVVTAGAQSIPGNSTTVSGALYVEKLSGSGYSTSNSGNTGSISGDISIGAGGWAPYSFVGVTSKLIGSGSGSVVHAANGTKTAAGSFAANDNNGGNMGSAGGSWALGLTTIPRGPKGEFDGVWAQDVIMGEFDGAWVPFLAYAEFDGAWAIVG